MKYIGPFLRLNSLDDSNILNQMFYLAKESLNDLALYSKCGVEITYKELSKNIPNFDSNTKSGLNPLLCIYKKASPKLISKHSKLFWDSEKFKRQIDIDGNAFMTLCLLELSEYYKPFENVDKHKYKYHQIYLELCKKQLEFYASYLRNHEGVFVNKLDLSDVIVGELKFEDKGNAFKFSNQALLMAAYAKCSSMLQDDFANEYKNFSLDILNMFVEFKDEMYNLSFNELLKLCLAFNLYYMYTKDTAIQPLILDLSDLLYDDFANKSNISKEDSIETSCLMFINCLLIDKFLKISKFKDMAKSIHKGLCDLFDDNSGLFIKENESKNITYTSVEIVLYLTSSILAKEELEMDKLDYLISSVYKNQLVNSGVVLSWPDSPTLDDSERYLNHSLKSDDLLDEQNFRLPSIPTPKNCELASILVKKVEYNKKKEVFKISSNTFDSNKNMFIYYLMILLYKHYKK